jgi:hypothetical protein
MKRILTNHSPCASSREFFPFFQIVGEAVSNENLPPRFPIAHKSNPDEPYQQHRRQSFLSFVQNRGYDKLP